MNFEAYIVGREDEKITTDTGAGIGGFQFDLAALPTQWEVGDTLTVDVVDPANGHIGSDSVVLGTGSASLSVQLMLYCTYDLPSTGDSHVPGADTGSFSVEAADTCTWTASADDTWITVTSGSPGDGNGTVAYSVAANSSSLPRSGSISVVGDSGDTTPLVFSVDQTGVPCTFSINPTSASPTAAGGPGSVAVTAAAQDCDWTAVSNDAWITVSGGASGTGDGTVGYSVAANLLNAPRSGSITIAGETFAVSQAGVPCTFALTPTSQGYTEAGGTGSVGVDAAAEDCDWTAVSNDGWITVTGGAAGTGDGTVSYTVAVNTVIAPRSGSITIAGETFTVNQDPANSDPVIAEVDPTEVLMSEDGVPTAFSLTLHASDVDNDTLSWGILTPADHGSATAVGTGLSKAIGYSPVSGYTGPDSFVVQVTDGQGGSDSITVEVSVRAEIQYDLVVVYNLISVPFTNSGLSTANEVLAAIPDSDALWFWDVVNQRWSGQTLGGFNNFAIVPGSAYLVSVGDISLFDPDGYWAAPSFALKTGYNLITLPKAKAGLTTANALLADIPNANTVWYWNATTGNWSGQTVGGFNNFAVEPGRPYLVLMSADGTWPE